MISLYLRLGLLAVTLVMASQAWTHQQKESITRVLFNDRSGNIEVMHRFLLHDVEHAVKQLRKDQADILGSEQDREYFSSYVHRRFSISDQAGQVLVLSPVGHEIEGRFLWVYAEAAIPANIKSLTLQHDALTDIWPEQVNLVNVEYNKEVRSASFTGGNPSVTIDLTGR